jgi:hypothetical protein
MTGESTSWLVYWRDFFFDRSRFGLRVYSIIYHTELGWFYKSATVGDDVWLVIQREDLQRRPWHLAMRMRVRRKHLDYKRGRPYRLVPDPEASSVFCLDRQPNLEPLLKRLQFQSGRTLRLSGRLIGRALQTPRRLTVDDDAALARWALKLRTLW